MNSGTIRKALDELEGDGGYATATLYINEVCPIPDSLKQGSIVIDRGKYRADYDLCVIIAELEGVEPVHGTKRSEWPTARAKHFIPFSQILRIILKSKRKELEA